MKSENFRITDRHDRKLLEVKGGRVLVGRFPLMTEIDKNLIIDLYTEFTGESKEEIESFLEYKNEDLEFCS